jgi:peptidyl-prolyl cis-trans isomerase SurA
MAMHVQQPRTPPPAARRVRCRPPVRCLRALAMLAPLVFPVMAAAPVPPPKPPAAQLPTTHIVAVVNGDVISNTDVDDRARLFARSTGLPVTPDVLDRLKPQITRQLIDEKLRIQEVQRRHIVIQDKEIADALHQIEQRNGMPSGALAAKLNADGVGMRTLVDQVRTQLGWEQVLRQQLGDLAQVSDADIAEQQRLLTQQVGKTEYRVGEIFIPVDDPANTADAQRFAETVIGELRSGAPFAVVAAQFSQTQTALEGGDLGWVQPNQLDPSEARVVAEMPQGAVSNPLTVPGGISIVTLLGKREIGNQMGTVLSVRQVFLPFTTPLNPQAPTDQQRALLEKARNISASVHSCDQMVQVAKDNNSPRPPDPGEVRLEGVNPANFRQILATIPLDHATQPLIGNDGIAIMIVCSRDQKNVSQMAPGDIRNQLLAQRVELLSQQLQRDLRRKARIDLRPGAA